MRRHYPSAGLGREGEERRKEKKERKEKKKKKTQAFTKHYRIRANEEGDAVISALNPINLISFSTFFSAIIHYLYDHFMFLKSNFYNHEEVKHDVIALSSFTSQYERQVMADHQSHHSI